MDIFYLFLVRNIGKWNFVSCFQQNCLYNIKFKILSNKSVPNFKTSTENPFKKKTLKPSNKKIELMSFQFALEFSTFVPLVSWALWDLILFLISLPGLSKNNAVTNFLLEVNTICSPDFFLTRSYGKLISSLSDFFSCIRFVVYSCYHKGSTHCSSRKTVCTTDFY